MYLIRFNFFAIRECFNNFNFDNSPFGKLVKKDNVWIYLHANTRETLRKIENNLDRYIPFWFIDSAIVVEADSLSDCLLKFLDYISYGYTYQEKEIDYWTFINENLKNQKEQKRLSCEKSKVLPFSRKELNFENWPIEILSISAFKKCPLMQAKNGIIFCSQSEEILPYIEINDLCCICCENLHLLDDEELNKLFSKICIHKKLIETLESKKSGIEKNIYGKKIIFFDCLKSS